MVTRRDGCALVPAVLVCANRFTTSHPFPSGLTHRPLYRSSHSHSRRCVASKATSPQTRAFQFAFWGADQRSPALKQMHERHRAWLHAIRRAQFLDGAPLLSSDLLSNPLLLNYLPRTQSAVCALSWLRQISSILSAPDSAPYVAIPERLCMSHHTLRLCRLCCLCCVTRSKTQNSMQSACKAYNLPNLKS